MSEHGRTTVAPTVVIVKKDKPNNPKKPTSKKPPPPTTTPKKNPVLTADAIRAIETKQQETRAKSLWGAALIFSKVQIDDEADCCPFAVADEFPRLLQSHLPGVASITDATCGTGGGLGFLCQTL